MRGDETARLIDQPAREHLIDAAIDAFVKQIAGPVENEHSALGGRTADIELLLEGADRRASLFVNFQRADDAASVVWVQPLGRDGIDVVQGARATIRRRRLAPRLRAGGVDPNRPAVPGRYRGASP